MRDPAEAVRLFSHLIDSQDKWMARIDREESADERPWFGPSYALEELSARWGRSLAAWIDFLQKLPEERLGERVHYTATDGKPYWSLLIDIALQLNYHSIHHRAQVSLLLRKQGIEPPFIDYVGYTRR
jgi:uncharacterized damage-inducible protein DinB